MVGRCGMALANLLWVSFVCASCTAFRSIFKVAAVAWVPALACGCAVHVQSFGSSGMTLWLLPVLCMLQLHSRCTCIKATDAVLVRVWLVHQLVVNALLGDGMDLLHRQVDSTSVRPGGAALLSICCGYVAWTVTAA